MRTNPNTTGALAGKAALVTGAGRGIGRAIALAFAEEGADVVVTSRTASELQETAALVEALGRRALPVVTDMSDRDQIFSLVDRALGAFGQLDVVVSNAAPASRGGALVDMPIEHLQTMLTVNIEGTVSLLQAAGPHMLRRGSGSVIIVSSTLGLKGNPFSVPYGATKAALNHLTQSLAGEWGPDGVRVNALLPGPVETERVRPVTDDPVKRAQIAELFATKRWPRMEEITEPAVFLASDASTFVNGHLLVVDGGLSALARESGQLPRPKTGATASV
ncbi:SDR family NAD(P)-dependent oxidoreductase [Georgenia sp. AZ-5]|uniref:SDR family NAD(P)-dependent oxidoreductase n=1 Tax=Georgenia sp. AZ-5 TaxID=3367526 RepID=UPI0037550C3C